MPPTDRRRPPRPAPRRRLAAALLATLLAGTLGARAVHAGGATDPGACCERFAAAWGARAADAVVGCIEPQGKVTFQLFAYPLSGKARIMGPEQAKEALKIYFRKITVVGLKDVTPAKSPKSVRLYEYAYKAAGENARTTHLQVKLKQDNDSLWVLASVTESAKPRD